MSQLALPCFLFLMFFFADRISGIPGKPRTPYIGEDNPELPILFPQPPKCWGYGYMLPRWVYAVLGSAPGFMHAGQTLSQALPCFVL